MVFPSLWELDYIAAAHFKSAAVLLLMQNFCIAKEGVPSHELNGFEGTR
jgi:hypothetical protein